MKSKKYKVPFNADDGNLIEYFQDWKYKNVIWKDPEPFEGRLKLIGYSRGMSSAKINLRDLDSGSLMSMFLGDYIDMVRDNLFEVSNVYHCIWIPVKKGRNYGIKFVEKVNLEQNK